MRVRPSKYPLLLLFTFATKPCLSWLLSARMIFWTTSRHIKYTETRQHYENENEDKVLQYGPRGAEFPSSCGTRWQPTPTCHLFMAERAKDKHCETHCTCRVGSAVVKLLLVTDAASVKRQNNTNKLQLSAAIYVCVPQWQMTKESGPFKRHGNWRFRFCFVLFCFVFSLVFVFFLHWLNSSDM